MDYTTPVGKVRLLISDVDPTDQFFTELELEGYLALGDGSPLLAAADALEAIARNEALLSKKIRTQDLSTDGPAVAAVLQKQADGLRARYARETDAQAKADAEFVFGVVGGGTRQELEEYRL